MRKTKIICTLGPATDSVEMLVALIDAGANIFRLNMSHGAHPWCRTVVERVREAAIRAGRHVSVLMDLRGFAAHNAGCRFELRVLAESPAVTRVVVLCDGDTDLVVARAEAAQAAPGRFVWFDARALDRAASERVLAELCAGTAGAPAG